MNILQVTPHYPPLIGGVPRHVSGLCERLALGNRVTVFTCDPSGDLPREEEMGGVLVRRFHSFAPRGAYHMSWEMWRGLKGAEFDIVHGHNYHALPLLLSRFAGRHRFIVTPYYHGHGHTPFRAPLLRLYRPLGERVLCEADAVVALSRWERDLLLRDFALEPGRVAVVPSAIDRSEFAGREKKERGHRTILCVCRLERYKGVQYVIRALPLLDGDIRLEVVGTGTCKGELVGLARELGVAHRVDFCQELERGELLQRYADADLFVLLSRCESFSIAVAEALAAGLPCIVANASASQEWVDGESCFGIDCPIDVDGLARLVGQVIGRTAGHVELPEWADVISALEGVYRG